jgi:hypothetical protein
MALDSEANQSLIEVDAKAPCSSTRRGYVRPRKSTGWINVVFILFAELVGTGIMALPYTFAQTVRLSKCPTPVDYYFHTFVS